MRPFLHSITTTTIMIMLIAFSAFAEEIHVPEDFDTIQEAINSAEDDDVVLVHPGTYTENINFGGREITVGSLFLTTEDESYIDSTVIDGDGGGIVVNFRNGETSNARLSGFTITNGDANYGGGIYINNSEPTLDHLLITGNHAVRFGAGIYCTADASPTLSYVTVANNTADIGNGGIHAYNGGTATIDNSIFWGNTPAATPGGMTVTYSDIQGGYGGQGNIDANPQFANPGQGNYHLTANSPCVDTGDPDSDPDPDNTRADMGCFYFDQPEEPDIIVIPDTLDFGDVEIETSAELILIISNVGRTDLTVSDITLESEVFFHDFGDDEVVIEPDDTLEVTVTFEPDDIADFEATMTITSDDPDEDELEVPINGSGIEPRDHSIEVPGDYDTIQEGIDNAVDTDTILVSPGRYVENINFGGKAIMVTSLYLFSSDPEDIQNTIIDGDANNTTVVAFVNGEGEDAILTGFTLTNGSANVGGGMDIRNASPTLDHLLITGNHANNRAGAMLVFQNSNPVLTNLTITGNDCDNNGIGGIDVLGGAAIEMINSIVWDNITPDIAANQTITFSCIEGGYAGAGNIDEDPLFVDSDNGDFTLDWDSPCLDTGDPDSPEDPDETRADMGALYLQQAEGPRIVIDPQRLDFEEVIVDSSAELMLLITNRGRGDLTISNCTIEGEIFTTEFEGETVLETNEEYLLVITFAPEEAIDYEGTLVITSDDPDNGELNVPLTGTGVQEQPDILPDPAALDFGAVAVEQTAELTLTIRNVGFADLTVSDISVEEEEAFAVEFEGEVVIEPDDFYEQIVSFTPDEVADFAGTLLISSDSPGNEQLSVDLTGRGRDFIINVPDDFDTITEAIADAVDGDTVLVDDGTYNEMVNFDGKNIVIGSHYIIDGELGHIENTIIDGDGIDRSVIHVRNGETAEAVLSGFTITGAETDFGGGIYINAASPTLDHLLITGNHCTGRGAGIYATAGSQPTIRYVTVVDNQADGNQGGLGTGGGSACTVVNSIFWGNDPVAISGGQQFAFTDVEGGYAGQGNIDRDPQFTDPGNGDYRLEWGSPCKDAGDPNSPEDPDETRTDMGAFYLHQEDVPHIIVTPDTLAFGDVEAEISAELIVTVSNEGLADLTVTNIEVNGDGFSIDDFEEEIVVEPDTSFEVTVTFSPDEVQDYEGALFITSNDEVRDEVAVVLTGTGIAPRDHSLDVPGDYDTIQEAIDAAQDADTVLVQRGEYTENIDFSGKAIIVASVYLLSRDSEDIVNTIINGDQNDTSIATFNSGETEESVLTGFTLTNGTADFGAGVLCNGTSPTLDHLLIYGNVAQRWGGGIIAYGNATPTLTNLTVYGNDAGTANAGLSIFGGGTQATVGNSIFWANDPPEIPANQTITFSDVQGGYGGRGNIDADPLFEDSDNGDFNLTLDSPCLDTGDPNSPQDPDETRADMGALSFFQAEDPRISVSPRVLNFGEVGVDFRSDLILTISNIGRADLTISDITVEGEYFSSEFEDNIVIEPDNSYEQTVTFAPQEGGDYAGTLTIACDDPNNRQVEVPLSGTGADPDIVIIVRPDSLNFGQVTVDESADLMLTIGNTGNVDLTVSDISIEGDWFSTDFEDEIVVGSDDSVQVTVTYAPEEVGDHEATLTVTSDDPDDGEITVDLYGTCIRAGGIVINVPDDFDTIQEAIDASMDADTILVQPGVYTEIVNFNGKNVVVGSLFITTGDEDFIEETIIDGDANGRSVIVIRNGETEEAVLSGFTIRNADTDYGGGAYIRATSPTLDHLLITGNHVSERGAGIYATAGATPTLSYITVVNNTADTNQGGLGTGGGSTATVVNSIFWGNDPVAISAGQQFTYSCIEGSYAGNGNIEDDPLFVDFDNGDFHLTENSPCIDAGDPNSPEDDDRTRADIGAFHYQQWQGPRWWISPDSLEFGEVVVDQSSDLILTIGNDGNEDLTVSDVSIDGEYFTSDFEDDIVIEPDARHEITVTFQPGELGDLTATMTLTSDDPENGEVDVPLSGTGVAEEPEIVVDPEELDFGVVVVDQTTEMTVTISNVGHADLIVSDAEIEGESFGVEFEDNITIGIDESNELTVTFTPDAEGDFAGEMTITSNDPNREFVVVDLTGHGALPDISVEPEALDFGAVVVNQSAELVLTVSNTGEADLTVNDVTIEGNYFSVFFDEEIVIESDSSYALEVIFTPGEGGELTGTLTIGSDDPDEGAVEVSLTGVGVTPEIVVDPEELDFGEVAIEESRELMLTISNEGNGDLTVSNIYTEGEFFSVEFEGELTLEPNDSYEQTVGFAPERGDDFEGTLTIESNDPQNGELAVNLTGVGRGPRIWEVGSFDTPGSAEGVYVRGDYAYVADYWEGLQIIDVSDPTDPQETGSFDTPGTAYGVFVSGDYAYVADFQSGLRIIDISDPENPDEVGSFDTPGRAYAVYVVDDHAYVADGTSGLRIIDVSNPAEPGEVGSYNTPGQSFDVFVVDNYAYVADQTEGLRIIDVSNPEAPDEIGYYETVNRAYGIYVVGDYAYVTNVTDGLRVIDVSSPEDPQEAGDNNTPGEAYGVYVFGDYAYVADGAAGLRVIDITNPEEPSEVDGFDTPEFAINVFILGDYAYVADEGEGIRILDISYYLPPAPEIVVTPVALDFGPVVVDVEAELTLTISNEGNLELNVTDVTIRGAPTFLSEIEDELIIEPDDSYELAVTFAPEEVGNFEATLTITSDDEENPEVSVDLAGIGRVQLLHVPDDYNSIQAAIDAAFVEDTVLVSSGTYTENIDFSGKDIIVGSLYLTTGDEDYIASTIIDGDANGSSVVVIRNDESEAARLTGFTLRNGDTDFGGGIYVNSASPSLDHLLITGNHASRRGGGVYATSNAVVGITDVTVVSNTAEEEGGGLNISGGAAATIVNGIFFSNEPAGLSNGLTVTYSDCEGGYNGEGNIDADPLFVDADGGDYYLTEDSPCIDAGDPDAPEDPDETRSDMGAFYFDQPMEPDIFVDPESLDFGDTRLGGEIPTLELTIGNEGRTNLTFSTEFAVEGDYFGYEEAEEGEIVVAPDESFIVFVWFDPREIGDFEGSLTITSDDPDEQEVTVQLTGTGLAPIFVGDPEELDFGEVVIGRRANLPLIITNEGNSDLGILDISVEVIEVAYFSCDFEEEFIIEPNDSAVITVTFAPEEAGEFEGGLIITTNDPATAEVHFPLYGVGRQPDIPEVGHCDTPENAMAVYVEGDFAYVTDLENGLRIINVSDPENPEEAGFCETPGNAYDVVVVGDYAYVADDTEGLRIIDISNPEEPEEVGNCDTDGHARGVDIYNDCAYIADFENGFQIIVINDPENPEYVWGCDTDGEALSVDAGFLIAFLADNSHIRVIVYDMINGPPEVIRSVETPGQASDVMVIGDHVFVADGDGGLRIMDWEPGELEEVGAFEDLDDARALTVLGSYCYIADVNSGLHVIDVSDPENPDEGAAHDTEGEARGVTVNGDYAYIADGENGLVILDVSDFVQYPDIVVEPEDLDFGEVLTGTEAELTLNISNEGNWILTISDISTVGQTFLSDFEDEVIVEAMGDPYQLTVTFSPDAVGDYEGTITIVSDDPDEGEVVVSLAGVGVEPDIAVDTEALDFGEVSVVGDGEELTVTITNEGTSDLTISGVEIRGAPTFLSSFDDEVIIEPEGVYELTVTFAPDEVGRADATLTIVSDDPDEGEVDIALTGVGIPEDLKLYVPDDYGTIQEAIDAAQDGDSILVHPGTYTENIHYSDKNIVIGSLFMMTGDDAYVDSTIIDGDGGNIVVNMRDNLTSEAVLTGFTITNGSASYGAGIYINASSPVLDHLIITGNNADRWGAGIYSTHDAHPTLINVTVSGNVAQIGNAGIHTYDNSTADVVNSIFWGNQPASLSGDLTATYSCFEGGYGGNGNIDTDPQFIDAGSGNYHLVQGSPCIDAGDPNLPDDPDESRSDMGALHYRPSPSIAVSPDALDFGEVAMGQRGVLQLTISNEGNADLVVSDVAIDGDYFYSDFEDEITVEADGSYNLVVTFAPEETGNLSGTLTITSNDQENSEVTVNLSGVGREPSIDVVGSIDTPGDAQGILVVNDFAYIADGSSGLRIIDVSDPENPDELGSYDTPGISRAVFVVGDYAYAADFGSGLRIIDISDPENPEEVGALERWQMNAWDVCVEGDYAYVADESQGHSSLSIINISDPENPDEISTVETPGNARGVAVNGNYAYLAAAGGGLRIIDVSNPDDPDEVGSFDTPGQAFDVVIVRDYAYVAQWADGLIVVDVSDPENPAEVGSFDTEGEAMGIDVRGNSAFVADRDEGLRIIDITDPEDMSEVAAYNTPGLATRLQVVGDLAYVADGEEGLIILDVTDFVPHPAIAVSTDNLDFGDVSITQEVEEVLVISNVGDGSLTVSDITLEGDAYTMDFDGMFILEEAESYELTVTFTPDDEGEFLDTLRITSDDAGNRQVTVNLSGFGVNDAPVAVNPIDDITVDEDSGFLEIADLDDVFEDPNGDEMAFSVAGPNELRLDIDDENMLTMTPDENFNGADMQVTVTADDGRNGGRMMVRKELPTAAGWQQQLSESDWQQDTRQLRSLTTRRGRQEENESPRRDATGDDVFSVTINAINDEPVWEDFPANNEVVATEEDLVEFDLVAQDDADNNDQLTIVMADDGGLPDGAELTDNGNGTAVFSWQTTVDDENEYNPVFTVSDDSATVELQIDITVNHLNQAPIVINPIDDIEIEEDADLIAIADLDTVFADPDEDELTFDVVEVIDELSWNIDDDNVLTIEPAQDYFGESNVIVEADDGMNRARFAMTARFNNHLPTAAGWQRDLRTVKQDQEDNPRRDVITEDEFQVSVTPVNDPPVIIDENRNPMPPEIDIDLPEDQELSLILSATDVDDDDLEWVFDDPEIPGDWHINDPGNGFFEFVWTPGFEGAGQYSIVFTVSDDENATDELTVNINVFHVNRPPIPVNPIDDIEIDEDSGQIEVADLDDVFADPDGDDLGFSVEADDPLEWDIDNENVLFIEAPDDFNGDSLEVTVTADDGMGRVMMAMASFFGNPDASFDRDKNNRQLRSVGSNKASGPRRDDTVDDVFLVTVLPINDPPFWVDPPDTVEADEGDEVSFVLTADDVDLDYEGDDLTLELRDDDGTEDLGAEFTDNDDNTGTFTWQTSNGDEGEYNLEFEVRDSENEPAFAEVLIIIAGVNEPPYVENPIPDVEVDEDPGLVVIADLDTVFSDPDEDELSFAIIGAVRPLNMEIDQDNVLFFHPDTNFNLPDGDEITIRATDPSRETAEDVFLLTINPVNDEPIRIGEIDSVRIDEDPDPRRIDIADLDDIFRDPDEGDSLVFSFSISEEIPDSLKRLLNMVINPWNFLYFTPADNFNIPDGWDITIMAEDTTGESIDYDFHLTINPVNDLPTAFDLLTPENGSFVSDTSTVEFTWEESIDVEDSTVTYAIVFSYEDEELWYRGIEETSFTVNLAELEIGLEDTTSIEWLVWAYDEIDSLESESSFELLVTPLGIADEEWLFPTELTLGPIYPNPFNAKATVVFGLPTPAHVLLTVYDLSGRNIATLVNGYMQPGFHSTVLSSDDLTSGVYFVRIVVSGEVLMRKVMLIR